MIKAVVLDVDGVIVGGNEGINFPLPHTEVILKLKSVRAQGLPLVLCTAKFGFAIRRIIDQAELNNPHIADGGALIMGPVGNNSVIKTYGIEKSIVLQTINHFIERNLYLELFTTSAHYIQNTQVSDFSYRRTKILQLAPSVVESLSSVAEKEDIIKMITIIKNKGDVKDVEQIVQKLGQGISLIWSRHPYLDPFKFGIMTAQGVSKANAVKEVLDILKIPVYNVLAIGDTESDWAFMKDCGYVATLENGDAAIKKLVRSKGEEHSFIGHSVEDNGLISILEHFEL